MKADWLLLHLTLFGEFGPEQGQSETTLEGGFATFDLDQSLSGGVVRWPKHRLYHSKGIISANGGRWLDEQRDSHFVVSMGRGESAAYAHSSEAKPAHILGIAVRMAEFGRDACGSSAGQRSKTWSTGIRK